MGRVKLPNTSLAPLNAELNPICHLLALLEGATVVDGSGLRVNCRFKQRGMDCQRTMCYIYMYIF